MRAQLRSAQTPMFVESMNWGSPGPYTSPPSRWVSRRARSPRPASSPRRRGWWDVRKIGWATSAPQTCLRRAARTSHAATLTSWMRWKGTIACADRPGNGAQHRGDRRPIGAFLVHCYPAWLGFKGGKGVATYIGVLLWASTGASVGFLARPGCSSPSPTPLILPSRRWFGALTAPARPVVCRRAAMSGLQFCSTILLW